MSCRRVFSWIANILFWGAIALAGYAFSGDATDIQGVSAFLCVIFGIMYYLETFICSYCSYLSGITTASVTYEDMDKMFKGNPSVRMEIECYHTIHRRKRGPEKVVTHRASEEFFYKSWRDVSGEFKLDTALGAVDDGASYILLTLSVEVQFAPDGTAEDYNMKKSELIQKNKFDRTQGFKLINTIPDFRESIFVQVSDRPPCCVGVGYFILFGLLTFNAIYSSYLDSCCNKQKFSIKKLISTRQDLNTPQMKSQYAYYDPRMVLGNQMVIFYPSQDPQVHALNQPAAQQYMGMQMLPQHLLFAPTPKTEEILEMPQNDTQSMLRGNQSSVAPHQSYLPQNAYPQYGIPQGQYPPPQGQYPPPQGQYPPPQHLVTVHPQVNH